MREPYTPEIEPFAESEYGDWSAWPRHPDETPEQARDRIVRWGRHILGTDDKYADDRELYERGDITAGWVKEGECPTCGDWYQEAKEGDPDAKPAWIVRPDAADHKEA